MPEESLLEQAEAFAVELTSLLQRSVPDAPRAVAEVLEDRVVVSPESKVLLFVNDEPLATLDVHLQCQLDSRGTWLAIEASSFVLTAMVDRTPVLRFDYVRAAHSCPGAHIQVHAHRGALSHLLSKAGHEKPHEMSALHVPVGGSRFRPCLEDVIQFLVEECRFDHLPGWQSAVEEGRAVWRRKQVRAVVRDFQGETVALLRDLGYSVEPPAEGIPEPGEKPLHAW